MPLPDRRISASLGSTQIRPVKPHLRNPEFRDLTVREAKEKRRETKRKAEGLSRLPHLNLYLLEPTPAAETPKPLAGTPAGLVFSATPGGGV